MARKAKPEKSKTKSKAGDGSSRKGDSLAKPTKEKKSDRVSARKTQDILKGPCLWSESTDAELDAIKYKVSGLYEDQSGLPPLPSDVAGAARSIGASRVLPSPRLAVAFFLVI
jgi:hypothetical protein